MLTEGIYQYETWFSDRYIFQRNEWMCFSIHEQTGVYIHAFRLYFENTYSKMKTNSDYECTYVAELFDAQYIYCNFYSS